MVSFGVLFCGNQTKESLGDSEGPTVRLQRVSWWKEEGDGWEDVTKYMPRYINV